MRNRAPSVGMFSLSLSTNDYFGVPVSASPRGLMMDVDHIMQAVLSKDGDTTKVKQYMLLSGSKSSELEHSVPERLFSTQNNPAQGISAVKALKLANDQGIPIYTVTQSNISTILPQLQIDSSAISDIQNAVNAGKIVTVSKTNVNFNGQSVCGFIIIDPITGAGAYMIANASGALILIAIITVLLMYALLPAIASGGFISIFGVIIQGSSLGAVFDTAAAMLIILATKLTFIFYIVNEDFNAWLQSQCNNITNYFSPFVEEIFGQTHPITVLVSLLGQLCDE